jgi:hypothetical protein
MLKTSYFVYITKPYILTWSHSIINHKYQDIFFSYQWHIFMACQPRPKISQHALTAVLFGIYWLSTFQVHDRTAISFPFEVRHRHVFPYELKQMSIPGCHWWARVNSPFFFKLLRYSRKLCQWTCSWPGWEMGGVPSWPLVQFVAWARDKLDSHH